jgi:hypothetical protein
MPYCIVQDGKIISTYDAAATVLCVSASLVHNGPALGAWQQKMGIDWKWQAMDGVTTKAPLGGKRYRRKSHRQS